MTRATFAAIWLSTAAAMLPLAAGAGEAGDAVFAERGPWSLPADGLRWSVNVSGPAEAAGFQPVTDGSISLTQMTDPADQQPVLQVTQESDRRNRKIGPFPISGGDPVLTFFLEQVTRDMAALTGGSPFYIRNRLKDALFRSGQIDRDGDSTTATFLPFAGDDNAERMQGFETLELRFVLGDPTQPIRELQAMTTGAQPGYDHHMVLQ